jgi:transglutaminase-like putative cysteine protease
MDYRKRFTAEAARAEPQLDSMLLAVAAEFERVDVPCCAAELDRVAERISQETAETADIELRAEGIARAVARAGYRAANQVSPEDALLPDVLARRRGHPLILTAACVAASRLAGIDARPVRACAGYLVGVSDRDRTLLVDPAGNHEGPPGSASWMCAHEVAFEALGELSHLFALHGRIEAAIRASKLRADLPVRGEARQWVGFQTQALRARLN